MKTFLKKDEPMQWISVEDGLPSNSNRVLVYGVYRRFETKMVDILRYQGKDYGWEEQSVFTVTHWMPLPEPPKGENIMGLWCKPQEWFKKFCKKDLREVCREKYGDDFVKMYDMVNRGEPIGNLEETKIFLAMVEEAKRI